MQRIERQVHVHVHETGNQPGSPDVQAAPVRWNVRFAALASMRDSAVTDDENRIWNLSACSDVDECTTFEDERLGSIGGWIHAHCPGAIGSGVVVCVGRTSRSPRQVCSPIDTSVPSGAI